MVDQEHLVKITGALKTISEALQVLDKRVRNNTELIRLLAGIDKPSEEEE
tara:strand:- start:623 stop:772 length:150 start_codon:yes stop_codon:yes gene_type:complete